MSLGSTVLKIGSYVKNATLKRCLKCAMRRSLGAEAEVLSAESCDLFYDIFDHTLDMSMSTISSALELSASVS